MLTEAVPFSEVLLRGSLAAGNADEYSDIDLLWIVPDGSFAFAMEGVRASLGRVGAIESLRSDPELWSSLHHRVLFVRFSSLPLFWRVDLEVFARSAAGDPDCDVIGGEPPREWSRAESALSNAVAAIKACRRNQVAKAQELLERALLRLGAEEPVSDVGEAIVRVVELAQCMDPATSGLAERILRLIKR